MLGHQKQAVAPNHSGTNVQEEVDCIVPHQPTMPIICSSGAGIVDGLQRPIILFARNIQIWVQTVEHRFWLREAYIDLVDIVCSVI
jgi:hypothetical protein